MLESGCLLLQPWAPATPGRHRLIVDASGQRLGMARLDSAPAFFLLPWPKRSLLTVFETEDDALLCTAHGPLASATWWVEDADGYWVGAVSDSVLWSYSSRALAWEEPLVDGRRFRDGKGQEWARLRRQPEGLQLTFADAVAGQPFMRMLLLVAALVEAP